MRYKYFPIKWGHDQKIEEPDLIIQDISWSPSNPKQGDTVTINVKTKNQGSVSAGGFYVCYYVDGSYYARDYVSSLSAGSTTTTSFSWTADCGSHSIKAVADCYDAVTESNEGNNARTEYINIVCKSDLIAIKAPAVWLYGIGEDNFNNDKVIDNLTKIGVRTVFLDIRMDLLLNDISYTNEVHDFIGKAHDSSIFVHAWLFSGIDVFNISESGVYVSAKSQTEKIVEFNNRYEHDFDGIHVDAEPSQLFDLKVTPPSSRAYKIVRGIIECPICHKKHDFTNNWENNPECIYSGF